MLRTQIFQKRDQGQRHSDPKMVYGTPPLQDASMYQNMIFSSYNIGGMLRT